MLNPAGLPRTQGNKSGAEALPKWRPRVGRQRGNGGQTPPGLNLCPNTKPGSCRSCCSTCGAAGGNLWHSLGAAAPRRGARPEPRRCLCGVGAAARCPLQPRAGSIAAAVAVPGPLGCGGKNGSQQAPKGPPQLGPRPAHRPCEIQPAVPLLGRRCCHPKHAQSEPRPGGSQGSAATRQRWEGAAWGLREHRHSVHNVRLWENVLSVLLLKTASNKLADSARNTFYFFICFLQKCLTPKSPSSMLLLKQGKFFN